MRNLLSNKPTLAEVPVLEVHKLVQFLNHGRHNIRHMTFCPNCFMATLTSTKYVTSSWTCICCKKWFHRKEELMTLGTTEYLAVLTALPLKDNGHYGLSAQERILLIGKPQRTYEDLTEAELHLLDKISEQVL